MNYNVLGNTIICWTNILCYRFVRLYRAIYHDLWHIFEKRALLIIILNIHESFVLFIDVTRGPVSCIVVYIFMPVQWNCKKKKCLNLNLCHNFWIIRSIRFISGMHNELWNPCKLHQGQWPCDLWIAFLKTLTFTITFEPIEVLVLYISCAFLVLMLIHSYNKFWPSCSYLCPVIWPTYLKTLTLAMTVKPLE